MINVVKRKVVSTRKPHICFGCGREFPIGTKMEYSFVADFKPFSCYLCPSCQEVMLDLANDNGGYIEFGFADLRDDALAYERGE